MICSGVPGYPFTPKISLIQEPQTPPTPQSSFISIPFLSHSCWQPPYRASRIHRISPQTSISDRGTAQLAWTYIDTSKRKPPLPETGLLGTGCKTGTDFTHTAEAASGIKNPPAKIDPIYTSDRGMFRYFQSTETLPRLTRLAGLGMHLGFNRNPYPTRITPKLDEPPSPGHRNLGIQVNPSSATGISTNHECI
ncbi:hypothetical protein DSO57_1008529 [Entomophthora muscae]|uniref:Uncharacterized protein n=1 Tax=Entomophthora muscae TaxID=34485 RepID=A0ACC2UGP4_9FUNG|nr:hypothetical protein DSO57_1008529 [Entomophthora muscae]